MRQLNHRLCLAHLWVSLCCCLGCLLRLAPCPVSGRFRLHRAPRRFSSAPDWWVFTSRAGLTGALIGSALNLHSGVKALRGAVLHPLGRIFGLSGTLLDLLELELLRLLRLLQLLWLLELLDLEPGVALGTLPCLGHSASWLGVQSVHSPVLCPLGRHVWWPVHRPLGLSGHSARCVHGRAASTWMQRLLSLLRLLGGRRHCWSSCGCWGSGGCRSCAAAARAAAAVGAAPGPAGAEASGAAAAAGEFLLELLWLLEELRRRLCRTSWCCGPLSGGRVPLCCRVPL